LYVDANVILSQVKLFQPTDYWRMRLILTLFTLFGISVYPAPSHTTSIAAVFNTKVISTQDLHNRVKMALMSSMEHNNPKLYKEIQGQVLQTLIDEEIQLQIGEEYGINISGSTLEAAIRDIENQNNLPTGGLKEMLKANGIPFATMEKHIKASIIWREYIRNRYENLVQVSDSDVERALRELKAAIKETRYDLSEIVLYFNDQKDTASVKTTADRLVAQLRQGAQFTMLAQQFSNTPTALRGGYIGWVPASKLEPHVAKILHTLESGSITPPIKTERGYHIYFLRSKLAPGQHARPETYYSFKQVFIPNPKDAFAFEIQEHMQKIATMAKQITSCRVVEKMVPSKEAKIQEVNDIPAVNLPEQLRQLLEKTKKGHATRPIDAGEGAMVFVLCDKRITDPKEPTKDEIRAQLIETKLQNVAEQELRTRRASAHVDKRL
jgi:peptidyl-prolyl cis-trans isomerase SurA